MSTTSSVVCSAKVCEAVLCDEGRYGIKPSVCGKDRSLTFGTCNGEDIIPSARCLKREVVHFTEC